MTDAPEPAVTIESETPTTPAPKKGRTMIEMFKNYRELVVGIGALVAAIVGLAKPTDTTATESSFQWTQQELERVSADNRQTHTDLVALHQYLVTYVKSQKKLQAFQLEQLMEDELPPPTPRHVTRRSGRAPAAMETPETVAADAVPEPMQEAQQIVEDLPDLPTIKSQAHVFKKESFDAIIQEE
jgi:hypothetical protein